MVAAQHALLTQGLGVTQLRLIMGTSMGCMHAFVWGETYPGFCEALMPLACEPVEIAGLNRMWRQAGDRRNQERSGMERAAITRPSRMSGLRTAQTSCCSSPARRRFSIRRNIRPAPRPAQFAEQSVSTRAQVARRQRPHLPARFIAELQSLAEAREDHAPRMWINSADDFINPRNFAYAAAGREADEERRISSDPGKHRDPRPRHPHLGEVLEGGP